MPDRLSCQLFTSALDTINMAYGNAAHAVASSKFLWDPARGLVYKGIARAIPSQIKIWARDEPPSGVIRDHYTNPSHRSTSTWWDAQGNLYGVEYRVEEGEDATDKCLSQFRFMIQAMAEFKPTRKVETIEIMLQAQLARQGRLSVPESPALATIPQDADIPGISIKQEESEDQDHTSRKVSGPRYVIPALRGQKRKDPPTESDGESGPVPKSRRIEEIAISSSPLGAAGTPEPRFISPQIRNNAPPTVPEAILSGEGSSVYVGNLAKSTTLNAVKYLFGYHSV